jgi:hypothetical protein
LLVVGTVGTEHLSLLRWVKVLTVLLVVVLETLIVLATVLLVAEHQAWDSMVQRVAVVGKALLVAVVQVVLQKTTLLGLVSQQEPHTTEPVVAVVLLVLEPLVLELVTQE